MSAESIQSQDAEQLLIVELIFVGLTHRNCLTEGL